MFFPVVVCVVAEESAALLTVRLAAFFDSFGEGDE